MAVEDAYGAEQWRECEAGAGDEVAFRTERITRSTCHAVAEYAFREATKLGARVYGGPKWTVSPIYEGMLKEEMDAAAARHPEIDYRPVLIDATYAGLLSGATDAPLVIPALNRDGDCLSDLILPMFGSIAGAESILMAFGPDYETTVAMAEAPHGTAPALLGKDLANPLAMILACGATPPTAAGRPASARRARFTRGRWKRSPPASRRPTSPATPARPSSPTPSWTACGPSSMPGPRSGPDLCSTLDRCCLDLSRRPTAAVSTPEAPDPPPACAGQRGRQNATPRIVIQHTPALGSAEAANAAQSRPFCKISVTLRGQRRPSAACRSRALTGFAGLRADCRATLWRRRWAPKDRSGLSVRAPPYLYEHMFLSPARRLRALLNLADDFLGDPEPALAPPHPHRRPVQITYRRRPGSVLAAPAHCLSPVRSSSGSSRRVTVR